VWKEQKVKVGFERPVIIHRAILGSVERFVAILTEHFGGKWPFWVSPRQIMVVPVAANFNEYAKYVTDSLINFGFHAEFDASGNTLNKKVRNAQVAQWNYIAVVGEKEEAGLSVTLRARGDKSDLGDFTITDLMKRLKAESEPSSKEFNKFGEYKGRTPESIVKEVVAAAVQDSSPKAAGKKADAKPAPGSPKAAPAGAPKAAKAAKGADGDEAFLDDHPYLGGFGPSKKDASVFASLTNVPKTPNMARWYEHISSFTSMEKDSWA